MTNSRNKQFINCNVMESHTVLLHPAWDVNHPFSSLCLLYRGCIGYSLSSLLVTAFSVIISIVLKYESAKFSFLVDLSVACTVGLKTDSL